MEGNALLSSSTVNHVMENVQNIHDTSQWDVSLRSFEDETSVEIEKSLEREDEQYLKLKDNGKILGADDLKTSETNLKIFFNKILEGTYIIKNSQNDPIENKKDGNLKETQARKTYNYALLAAEAGDFQMLELFLRIKKEQIKVEIAKKEDVKDHSSNGDTGIIATSLASSIFNFKELTENKENILHLVLKRPKIICIPNIGYKEIPTTQDYANYMKCANLILDPNIGIEKQELFDLINQQDNRNNTPLHYAISSWPPKIIKQLLKLGAHIGLENNDNEDALSKMSTEFLKDYLETDCIQLDKSSGKLVDIENYNGKEKDEDIFNEILEEHEPSCVQLIHSNVPISYDFSILVPNPQSQKEMYNTKRSQKRQVSETDVLRKISTGRHQELLTHPFLRFFIWLKWTYIRPYMLRKLMLQLLSCTCFSWYILNKYSLEQDTHTCFYKPLYPMLSDLCDTGSDNASAISDNTSSRIKLPTMWIRGNNSNDSDDFGSLPGCDERDTGIMQRNNWPCHQYYQYCSTGYMAFILQFIMQLCVMFITSPLRKLIMKCLRNYCWPQNRSGKTFSKYSIVICLIIDALILFLNVLVLVRGRCVLVWELKFLLPATLVFRLIKLLLSLPSFFAQFLLLPVILVYRLAKLLFSLARRHETACAKNIQSINQSKVLDIYLLKSKIWKSWISVTSILKYSIQELWRDKKQILWYLVEIMVICFIYDLFLNGKSDTSIAKGISAIALFFIWYDFLCDVVVCASYNSIVQKFKTYVMMLKKVTTSFFTVLAWYSILFIVFGLGFYILFQPTLEEKDKNKVEKEREAFKSKISSVFKTFVMFTGELDYSDLPINSNASNMEKHTIFDVGTLSFGVIVTYFYVF